MGTTRIKVIDLSSEQKEIKTSRKHAEKLAGVAKLKGQKLVTSQSTEKKTEPSISVSPPVAKPSRSIERGSPSATVPSMIKTKSKVTTGPRHRGKKYQQATKLIDKSRSYTIAEALDLLLETSTTKFDPTVEIHLNVAERNLRGTVNFPHPVSRKTKQTRYLVFGNKRSTINDKQIIWADEKTIADIANGKLKPKRDFDTVLAQPKFMPQLAKIAKILGPAGLMPNPKTGTICQNPDLFFDKTVKTGENYQTELAAPIIHAVIGKLSAKPAHLAQNLETLMKAIGPTKIKKAVIKSTMSPGIKIDIDSISAPKLQPLSQSPINLPSWQQKPPFDTFPLRKSHSLPSHHMVRGLLPLCQNHQ